MALWHTVLSHDSLHALLDAFYIKALENLEEAIVWDVESHTFKRLSKAVALVFLRPV